MAEIFMIHTLSTHWQRTVTVVTVGRYDIGSGNAQDIAAAEHAHVPSCIELNCTKDREDNGRQKDRGEKRKH